MKRTFFVFAVLISIFNLQAQRLVVESFKELPVALEKKGYDPNDYLWALIIVNGDSIPDLVFNSSYIIEEDRSNALQGIYKLYVSKGLRTLEIRHDDYLPERLDLREGDYAQRLEPGKTYELKLITEGQKLKPTQTVIFDIKSSEDIVKNPEKGIIKIGNEKYAFTGGGLQMEFLPGIYEFEIIADYFHKKEGNFTVNDVSKPQNLPTIELDPIICEVEFVLLDQVKDPELIVDSRKKGKPGKVRLPKGPRKVRVRAANWQDFYDDNLFVEEGKKFQIKMEPKPVIPVVVYCDKSYQNPVLYIDEKAVSGWTNNGKAVNVPRGKHYVKVIEKIRTDDSSGVPTYKDGRSKAKYIRFNPDMDPVTIM